MRTSAVIVWTLAVAIAAEVKDAPVGPAFSCRGRSPGYYADLETNCQDYHMCDAGGRRYTYSCPNQTRFQQKVMICDHWFMVDCSLSESHFDANLLIGQRDKHFQQDNAQGTTSFKSPNSHSQAGKDVKKNFLPSLTKKILDEKNASVKYTDTKFSTPTGVIKPTTERGLSREFANNPFFSSLTRAPSSVASKVDRGSSTYQQRKDQEVSPTASSSESKRLRVTSTPPLPTPPLGQTAPPLRNTPSFPNNEQRRASTSPTTALPLTRDYGFVTREGHVNHLSRTEPPRLFRNDLSKVIAITSFGTFTTEPPPLTTRYESPTTRRDDRVDVRAPLPLTRATPTPSLVSTVRVPPSPSPRTDRTQTPAFQAPSNATQWLVGLQKTPGGFRYATPEAPRETGRPTTFGAQGPTGTDSSTGTGYATGTGAVSGGAVPTTSGGSTGTGYSTGSTGKWFSTGSDVSTGTGVSAKADVSSGGELPTGLGISFGSTFPSGSDVSSDVDVPIGPDVSLETKFPSGHELSFEDLGSTPGEEEDDLNTVEVRIPDPRRMFFIPDNAASEAEMLKSTNETVLRISLPSSRHHGPMRFKGVRGAKGRRSDCPQCHPAFLLPGSCQPCVLIRR